MKGIYILFGNVTEKDLKLIRESRKKFEDFVVAIQLPSGKIGMDYLNDISQVRALSLEDIPPVIDFFQEGSLNEYLSRAATTYQSFYGIDLQGKQGAFLGCVPVVDLERVFLVNR